MVNMVNMVNIIEMVNNNERDTLPEQNSRQVFDTPYCITLLRFSS